METNSKAAPLIDVIRKWDGRLMLVAVTAKEAAAYAGVTEGFVWSCVNAKFKVPCEAGYIFQYAETDDEDIIDQIDYGEEYMWRIRREVLFYGIRRKGYKCLSEFYRGENIKENAVRYGFDKGWKAFPQDNKVMRRISRILNIKLEDLLYYDR